MQCWLQWREARLPQPDEEDEQEVGETAEVDTATTKAAEVQRQAELVEYIKVEAGSNLLFLNDLLKPADFKGEWTLSEALYQLHELREVSNMDISIRQKLNALLGQSARLHESVRFMLQCVARGVVRQPFQDMYDPRYFYTTRRSDSAVVGRTVAHFVDRCVARIAREYDQTSLLTEHMWLSSISEQVHHPIRLDFVVSLW